MYHDSAKINMHYWTSLEYFSLATICLHYIVRTGYSCELQMTVFNNAKEKKLEKVSWERYKHLYYRPYCCWISCGVK